MVAKKKRNGLGIPKFNFDAGINDGIFPKARDPISLPNTSLTVEIPDITTPTKTRQRIKPPQRSPKPAKTQSITRQPQKIEKPKRKFQVFFMRNGLGFNKVFTDAQAAERFRRIMISDPRIIRVSRVVELN